MLNPCRLRQRREPEVKEISGIGRGGERRDADDETETSTNVTLKRQHLTDT